MTRRSAALTLGAFGISLILSGCADGVQLPGFLKGDTSGGQAAVAASTSTKLVEHDVEAPEVFQVTDQGLWDGRPSLGGVWVAYQGVTDPERVIIRNQSNGKFVIGALFRREVDNPGPALQVSSDAADALGMLAGAPATLNVTALRREEVPIAPEAAPETPAPAMADAAGAITATPIEDVTASAAAAIDAAEGAAPAAEAKTPPARPASAALQKPYIQIGIFSVEQNAKNTAEALRTAGMVPEIKKASTSGKTYWRVLVGPAGNAEERATLLQKIKALGFTDAYFVTN